MYFLAGNVAKHVNQNAVLRSTNSKHGDADKVSSQMNMTPLCFDIIKSIVDTIKENIISEKLYGDEIDSVVKNFSATEALLEEVLPSLHKILPKQEPKQTAYKVILCIDAKFVNTFELQRFTSC